MSMAVPGGSRAHLDPVAAVAVSGHCLQQRRAGVPGQDRFSGTHCVRRGRGRTRTPGSYGPKVCNWIAPCRSCADEPTPAWRMKDHSKQLSRPSSPGPLESGCGAAEALFALFEASGLGRQSEIAPYFIPYKLR